MVSVHSQFSTGVLIGDVNCSGTITFADIPPFIGVLQTEIFNAKADINEDDLVNFSDIPPFIQLLIQQ